MRRDSAGTLVPFDFNAMYEEIPSIKRLNIDIEVLTMTPIDSSNVTPRRWVELAEIIRDNYARFDGFVVLHGTDTMSYTASALSFMLENLAKPVIFTGSQIPMGILRTDGRENLITALEISAATMPDGSPAVPEVALYFQNRLFRGNRTMKQSAEELSAFSSYNYPPLAEVGVNITYNYAAIARPAELLRRNAAATHNACATSETSEMSATCRCADPEAVAPAARPDFRADSLPALRIATELSEGVVVIKLFPGIGESILRAILSVEGLRGVVLETFGSGNAPTSEWFISALREAIARGIIVINVTQCAGGSVSMELYETGVGLQSVGVVSGHDMTTEAAVTKLMYLLGGNRPSEEVRRLLLEPIKGEFTA